MQGPFVADDGSSATVAGAACTGQDDPVAGAFTHFECSLAFDDGTGEEVLVHLLPGGEIFFKSSVAGS